TSVIPIIFPLAGDPVAAGFVTSLAHPGGNVTGLSQQIPDAAAKRGPPFRGTIPSLRRLAILVHAGHPGSVPDPHTAQSAARALGLEVATLEIRRAEDIAPALGSLKGRAEAIYVVADALINANRTRINALAVDARMATMHTFRELVEAGGLLGYG